jgi:hypothetical protein
MNMPIKRTVVLVIVLVVLTAGCAATGAVADTSAGMTAQLQQSGEEAEPNDSRQNATPIEFGEGRAKEGLGFVSGRFNYTNKNGTVVKEDVVDFFKFNASAGQAINIYFITGDASTIASITLYSPSGEVIESDNSFNFEYSAIGGVAEKTGTYYIRVQSQKSPSGLDQTYSFGVERADQDAFEPNDAIGTATPVTSGEQINGTIAKGDQDFFAIEADAGETITASVALRGTEMIGNTRVYNQGNIAIDILNAEGERLNNVSKEPIPEGLTNSTALSTIVFSPPAVEAASTESVNLTIEEADTYYVRVTEKPNSPEEFDIGGFRKYNLTVNTSDTTETPAPTASVAFDNQTTNGTTVTIESVTVPEGGFIAFHNASLFDGTVQNSVIGVSEPLSPGTHENVELTLFDVPGQNFSENMTLEENQTLIAMPHFDTNSNGDYDFITSNGSEDSPYTANGSAVTDSAFITSEEDEDERVCEAGSTAEVRGENDEDTDSDGAIDEDDEDPNVGLSNDDDDGDGAVDEDDECDDGDDGSDEFNSNAEDDDDGDGAVDEDDEADSGNSDDMDNDGDGAVDEDDEADPDD